VRNIIKGRVGFRFFKGKYGGWSNGKMESVETIFRTPFFNFKKVVYPFRQYGIDYYDWAIAKIKEECVIHYENIASYPEKEDSTKKPLIMTKCFSKVDNSYVGNPEDVWDLLHRGITDFQVAQKGHNTASVGWCEKEHKWYGWSHRAIFGFGIGSEIKNGDCAYVPKDREDQIACSIDFFEFDKDKVVIEQLENSYVLNQEGRLGHTHEYLAEYGKGEWKAQTLEDAKQMAIDFAMGVS